MKVSTFEGVVENGVVRLHGNPRLPENAKVYVVIPDVEVTSIAYVASPRLVHPEEAEDFKKQVIKED